MPTTHKGEATLAMLVSVIIPALNEAENIQRCVHDARRGYTVQQVEIVVVDGGSHDCTREIVPADATLIQSPRGRALQMNRGAAAAEGDILVFCHADTFLPVGWREAIVEALADTEISGGTFQTMILPAKGFLRWRNRWRFAANWRVMFGDQVQFMRRETFDAVGGFPEIPLMEDVEMARALHGQGKLVRLPGNLRVETSSRRFRERGVLRQILLNAGSMFRYLYLGAKPEQIAQRYRSSREQMLRDPGKRRLIVYARWPHAGRAKTRLAKGIGAKEAVGVYARLLFGYLCELAQADLSAEIELSVANEEDKPFFEQAFPELAVCAQQGADLGARMRHSLEQAFADDCTQVVLTGSDVPALSSKIVAQAFEALETSDAVIGPASDGGYYLIGMRAPGYDLFTDMPWSTADVSALTRQRAQQLGITMAEVPTLQDIDTLEDLDAWQRRVAPHQGSESG